MAAAERRWYDDSRRAGVRHLALGLGVGLTAGAVLPTPAATALAVASRMLGDAGSSVGEALRGGDLERARALLPTLVGRDPSGLDETEIARAVVESIAENTVDAVIAPLLWAAFGGGPGVLAHRAVNTLDAMVGHHSARYEHFGWASARLDDAMAYVPARVAALAVMAVRPRQAAAVWHAVRCQAPAHPSPNAGVVEAAFAAALGVRLGGANRYGDRIEQRGELGRGAPPCPADIERAVRLSLDVTAAVAVGLVAGSAAVGAVRAAARRRGRGRPR